MINHCKDEFAGRALQENVLPQIRPVAALREEGGLTPDFHELGDLLAVIEDVTAVKRLEQQFSLPRAVDQVEALLRELARR